MTPEERESLRVLGIPVIRAGIIRAALERGSVTLADLMSDLQAGRTTLIPHVKVLVDAGILRQSRDPAMAGAVSGFNRLIWTVDEAALRSELEDLRAALRIPPN